MTPSVVFEYFDWIEHTGLSLWIREDSPWAFPIVLILHTVGLAFLVGDHGDDQDALGGGASLLVHGDRGRPPARVHVYAFDGVRGTVLAGCFLAGTPNQYFINAAFQVKVGFFLVAGLNVAAFYLTMFKKVRNVGPGEQAPLFARIIGGVSLCSWIGVMTAGRLLTFYRPI